MSIVFPVNQAPWTGGVAGTPAIAVGGGDGGGESLPTDFYVFQNSGSGTLLYKSFNPNSGARADIASTGSIAVGAIASDGTFVFVGRANQATQQYAWNGTAFTSVFGPSTPAGLSNGAEDLLVDPSNTRTLIFSAVDSFASNVAAVGYQAAATYSFTNHNEAGSPAAGNRWRERLFDIRKTGEELQYGSLFVSLPGFDGSGYDVFAFDVSSNTISIGTEAVHTTNNDGHFWACDRDEGVVVVPVTGATCRIYTINKSTKAATYVGEEALTTTPYCAAMTNGVLVTADSGGNFRTYTRSGAVFTPVATLAIGNTNTTGFMYVSPYSKLVYFGNGSASHCLLVGADGSISSLGNPGIGAQSANVHSLAFLPAAMTVT